MRGDLSIEWRTSGLVSSIGVRLGEKDACLGECITLTLDMRQEVNQVMDGEELLLANTCRKGRSESAAAAALVPVCAFAAVSRFPFKTSLSNSYNYAYVIR